MGEKWKNLPFLGRTRTLVVSKMGTGTHGERQNGTGTNQSGTGTHPQKRVGNGIDPSSSPDFCTLALLSSNSYTNNIGTLIND